MVHTPRAEYSLASEAVYTDIPQNLPLVDGSNNTNGLPVYSYIGHEDTINPPDMLMENGSLQNLDDRSNHHKIIQSNSNCLYEELTDFRVRHINEILIWSLDY